MFQRYGKCIDIEQKKLKKKQLNIELLSKKFVKKLFSDT